MASNKGVSSPPILKKAFEPRVGLGLQGGGSFCIFHAGAESSLVEAPFYENIVARAGASGGAVHNLLVKSALAEERPDKILKNGRALWWAMKDCEAPSLTQMMGPMAGMEMLSRGLQATSDFSQAVRAGTPEAMPLFALKRIIERIVKDPEVLVTERGFANYTAAVLEENGVRTLETYLNPGIDEVLRSSALKDFGGYQGYFDEAYMFNPHLDRMMEEQELTDLILLTTNPYNPGLPVAAQSNLQAHDAAHESGLKFGEIHSEAQHLMDSQRKVKIHGIPLFWKPEWTVADKMSLNFQRLAEIEKQGRENTRMAIEKINANLGKQHTYPIDEIIQASELVPDAA